MIFKINPVVRLMQNVRRKASPSFAGLGLIIYRDFSGLPVLPLGNQANSHSSLPVLEMDDVEKILLEIAVADSPWHDGFHLMNAKDLVLTHISQYFSPPLKQLDGMPAHMGARQMAALLGSRLVSVECIVLLGQKGNISVFNNGRLLDLSGHDI